MNSDEMEIIYETHKNTIYRTAFAYLRNSSDAEDITHDVFVKRFTTDITFENNEKEKAWLITVTANKCRNLFNSSGYRALISSVQIDDVNLIGETEMSSPVFDAVMKLPEKYRLIVHLYYYEEYKISEICSITGKNESAVQTMLYRARLKLKKILGKEFMV